MKTGKIIRRIAMVISLVMLITFTVGTTYGYMVTSTDPITNVFVPNTVNVSGLTWSARSADNSEIPVGTLVRIARIEGVKVFVEKV